MKKLIDPRLGRRVQFDEKSRAFPIRELLPPEPLKSNAWDCNLYLDQMRQGSCVGHGWAHYLAGEPNPYADITEERALSIYNTAKTLDEYPGEDYSGTSVLAGAKATLQLFPGIIGKYRWAFGLDDVLSTLSHYGPVILGINWYEGMYKPNDAGDVFVNGEIVGGHCILANAIDVDLHLVQLHNSWGLNWGKQGNCYIEFQDLEKLLHEQGEACVPENKMAAVTA